MMRCTTSSDPGAFAIKSGTKPSNTNRTLPKRRGGEERRATVSRPSRKILTFPSMSSSGGSPAIESCRARMHKPSSSSCQQSKHMKRQCQAIETAAGAAGAARLRHCVARVAPHPERSSPPPVLQT
eukprot:CAMPEP_0170137560 /NCGR_PEP_ID=MMETSP0033_2-20121228/4254_1 /TAXON_ID=195969 /ORGANISM="Dolichomastix tenuilepis, Strain CCMP3274" /LENGTH=125 /DNA_ID=CAMNT_0010373445 /DNA_START=186 /DNA_END=564 /DNA_ORIENTATION=+